MRVCVLALIAVGFPQDAPAVDPARVNDAIKRGAEWLRKVQPHIKPWKHGDDSPIDMRADELILLTLVHAGVAESDGTCQALLKAILDSPLQRTYCVSLQAMALEEIDRVRYQWRIAQCAQFLADNQSQNGQWGYGESTLMPADLETPSKVAEATGPKPKEKPRPVRRIAIRKRKPGPASGDASNSQYAALGVRACADAGIVFEPQVLKRGESSWEQAQKDDGGWCYGPREGDHPKHASYGSMSAGGLASLAIYKCLLGGRWVGDRRVERGLKWLVDHFSVERMPGRHEAGQQDDLLHYYYLYALERACILYGTEKLGTHAWYAEGARLLLDAQAPEGTWGDVPSGRAVADTCFAVLFLRRATQPLEPVPTVDSKKK